MINENDTEQELRTVIRVEDKELENIFNQRYGTLYNVRVASKRKAAKNKTDRWYIRKPIKAIRFSNKYDLCFQDRSFDVELLLEIQLLLEVELLFDLEFLLEVELPLEVELLLEWPK